MGAFLPLNRRAPDALMSDGVGFLAPSSLVTKQDFIYDSEHEQNRCSAGEHLTLRFDTFERVLHVLFSRQNCEFDSHRPAFGLTTSMLFDDAQVVAHR